MSPGTGAAPALSRSGAPGGSLAPPRPCQGSHSSLGAGVGWVPPRQSSAGLFQALPKWLALGGPGGPGALQATAPLTSCRRPGAGVDRTAEESEVAALTSVPGGWGGSGQSSNAKRGSAGQGRATREGSRDSGQPATDALAGPGEGQGLQPAASGPAPPAQLGDGLAGQQGSGALPSVHPSTGRGGWGGRELSLFFLVNKRSCWAAAPTPV